MLKVDIVADMRKRFGLPAEPERQPSPSDSAADRIDAIMNSGAAIGRKGLAEHLATKTALTAPQVLAALAAAPREMQADIVGDTRKRFAPEGGER